MVVGSLGLGSWLRAGSLGSMGRAEPGIQAPSQMPADPSLGV